MHLANEGASKEGIDGSSWGQVLGTGQGDPGPLSSFEEGVNAEKTG